MLIAGASLGVLGNFLVAVILNFIWKNTIWGLGGDVFLLVIGIIAFFGSVWIVVVQLKELKAS